MYKLTAWIFFNFERTFSNIPYIIVICCVGHALSDMFLYLKMAVTYNCLYFEAFLSMLVILRMNPPFSIW